MAKPHCTSFKRVFSSSLGGYVKRCSKFSGTKGLSGLGKTRKKRRKAKKARKSRKRRSFSGLTSIQAYNRKCGCLKTDGKLKKGFRFGKSGKCLKARKK